MRRVLVGIKRVVDYNVRIRVKTDGSGVILDGVKMGINPFDEIALEEGLRIRESGGTDEVVVVSIGSDDAQQQLRTALAMGADRAILVKTESALEPLAVARLLLSIVQSQEVELVLLGKQGIDDDHGQTGQLLASLWGRPQATFASRVLVQGNELEVSREVDAGLEVIQVDLPAVVTVDLRLNEPRYVKLPDIMKAKRKPLEVVEADQLGVVTGPTLRVVATEPPKARTKGVLVKDVEDLVGVLRAKGLLS